MLPICCTNAAANADSVCVRVSDAELPNSASIAFATASAWSGFATRTMYQPTMPRQNDGRLLVEVVVPQPELRLVVALPRAVVDARARGSPSCRRRDSPAP